MEVGGDDLVRLDGHVRPAKLQRSCEEHLVALVAHILRELEASYGHQIVGVRLVGPENDPTLEVRLEMMLDASETVTTGFVTNVLYGDDHSGILDDPDDLSHDQVEAFVDAWFGMSFAQMAHAALVTLTRMPQDGSLRPDAQTGEIEMLEYGGPGGEWGPVTVRIGL